MATERLTMRNLREILRQKFELGRSHRAAAAAAGVSSGAVAGAVGRAREAGLDWVAICRLDDEALDERLYGPRGGRRNDRAEPDCRAVHLELRRAGVTLQLLHIEYLEAYPNGYRYSAYCERYREWVAAQRLSMRQVHIAGDKAFTDYSGKKPRVVDPDTGELVEVELFVGVLGASSYTYAEATLTQRVADWVGSHVRMMEFFGGVPEKVVPDQLKSAVTTACRYEPGIQRSYDEMARHYGTTILPARPRKPKDKAKVEVAVQVAQRWILGRIRNQVFFSLAELNERIRELLVLLNDAVMRGYGASRRELFERLDRPALKALPEMRFEYAEWRMVGLNVDYHFEHEHHYYSAPHALRQEVKRDEGVLWLRVTAATVELFYRDKRRAAHARSHVRGRPTTVPAHMPSAHRAHAEWTPARIATWATTVGPSVAALATAIMEERTHPEQGYRSCLGLIRLAKRYDAPRVDAACARALMAGARSYRHVESILRHGLDRAAAVEGPRRSPVVHGNVRGGGYYH